jgi:hypothetical protein
VSSIIPHEQGQFNGVLLCCQEGLGNLLVVVNWPEQVGLGKGHGTSMVECCQCHNVLPGQWCYPCTEGGQGRDVGGLGDISSGTC